MSTQIEAAWLAKNASQTVCEVLERAGFQALFVGGCVRNTLLGTDASDLDLSTDARPDDVTAVMQAAGYKVIPTGVEHGTVTAVIDHEPFEITTFRRDIETDGRRATVHFSTNILDDAKRRDFTMNALYCDRTGRVLDPLGGLDDVEKRCLRFVGDPVARVREDYLRILRFFRFHAWYADHRNGMDPDGLAACAENADGLDNVSAERIGAEMIKLLRAPEPSESVAAMSLSGILNRILPGADAKALPILIHFAPEPDAILRLAALGGEDVANRLRLSRAEGRRLRVLRDSVGSGDNAYALGYRLGRADGMGVLALRAALLETPMLDADREAVELGAQAEFPVKAGDLPDTLVGAEIGQRLRALESIWIDSRFALNREQLLSLSDRESNGSADDGDGSGS